MKSDVALVAKAEGFSPCTILRVAPKNPLQIKLAVRNPDADGDASRRSRVQDQTSTGYRNQALMCFSAGSVFGHSTGVNVLGGSDVPTPQ